MNICTMCSEIQKPQHIEHMNTYLVQAFKDQTSDELVSATIDKDRLWVGYMPTGGVFEDPDSEHQEYVTSPLDSTNEHPVLVRIRPEDIDDEGGILFVIPGLGGENVLLEKRKRKERIFVRYVPRLLIAHCVKKEKLRQKRLTKQITEEEKPKTPAEDLRSVSKPRIVTNQDIIREIRNRQGQKQHAPHRAKVPEEQVFTPFGDEDFRVDPSTL